MTWKINDPITPELCQQVLNTPMLEDNDAGVSTIREYLCQLLLDVWKYGEGFNGKRPFGNSGWEHDLYYALAEAGLIEGNYKYDSVYDYKDWYQIDQAAGNALVASAIQHALLG